MPVVAPRLLLMAPAIVVFLVVTIFVGVTGLFPLPWLFGLCFGLCAGVLTMHFLEQGAPAAALKSLDARPLEPGAEPRLESLVESVCASHGISEPKLYIVESRAPDAAVAGNANDTRLIVTTGALRQLDRLELEAVVARELVQFGDGIHAATVLASVAKFYGPWADGLRSRVLDDRRLARADIDGVQLTRYPPALAGAFEKAAVADGVPNRADSRHLWLVGPKDPDAIQPALIERIDTLREL